MSPYAVIDHLQLLCGLHGQPRHVRNSLVDTGYVSVLVLFQPGRFAYPVLGYLQLPGLRILNGCSTELI